MELEFEVINTYTDGQLMNFTNEPDNLFTKYFKDGKHVLNESVKPYRGNFEDINIPDQLDYNNLIFQNEPSRLTAEAISKFGVKNFPQFGSFGWYTTLYSNRNKVLAPINRRRSTYAHPQVSHTVDETITVTITDPQSIRYDCYRVMLRQGYFADEYITYERIVEIPKPAEAGIYELTVMGYREGGVHSVETDIIHVEII